MKAGDHSTGSVVLMSKSSVSSPVIANIRPAVIKLVTCSTRGKRKKPSTLTPRFGTPSNYRTLQTTFQEAVMAGDTSWNSFAIQRHMHDNDPTGTSFGFILDLRSKLLPTDSQLSRDLQNKLLEEIISQKSQLAVDLAELGKTKDMLANAGRDLLTFFKGLRSGRPLLVFCEELRKQKGVKGSLANRWLEYTYGWAPTVAGIYDSAEIFQKKFSAGDIITGKVGLRPKVVKQKVNSSSWTASVHATAKAKAYYQYTVRDPKLLALSQLGFTNPLSIAWELMPWSFVLDWFVDVGGYINRMDWALGLSDIYYQTMTRCSLDLSLSAEVKKHYVYGYGPCTQPGRATQSMVDYVRSGPQTQLLNSFKGFKPFTNQTVRLTSAVALVHQQLSAIPSRYR